MIALTREVSPAIAECELTHLGREPIDVGRAVEQHAAYEQVLRSLGWRVRRLSAGPDIPDSVFIEDMAVIFDELAVIARPGAQSRRREGPPVAEALAPLRPLRSVSAPGTLDGGDVLVAGRTVFVGRSSRTNDAGIEQLREIVEPEGYEVRGVRLAGCLHLKSAVTAVDEHVLLINRDWAPARVFEGFDLIPVHPDEPAAANVVRAGAALIMAAAFPRTRLILESRGFRVEALDVSELAKAEGAVTCCSLLIR